MPGHHLILGELTDYLTGQSIPDTHDERLRQHIARRLAERCGFDRRQIQARLQLHVRAGARQARVPLDFVVRLDRRAAMLVKYGPGSIVTRHRPALAMARLLGDTVVPVAVVTNGRDADVLDAVSGRLMGSGLDAIPTREQLRAHLAAARQKPVALRQAEMAARIVYAFEVDGSCPCDDSVCRLEGEVDP